MFSNCRFLLWSWSGWKFWELYPFLPMCWSPSWCVSYHNQFAHRRRSCRYNHLGHCLQVRKHFVSRSKIEGHRLRKHNRKKNSWVTTWYYFWWEILDCFCCQLPLRKHILHLCQVLPLSFYFWFIGRTRTITFTASAISIFF